MAIFAWRSGYIKINGYGRNWLSFIINFKVMKPFDVHLIIGEDNSSKQIARLDLNVELKP